MDMAPLTLVTIVAEAILQERILEDLRAAGIKGYTLTEVQGEGSRGIRASTWQGHNIKIETLVSVPISDIILARVAEHYFEHYAVVAYRSTVEVLRPEKFS
ncbi:MAG: transcriptional regulator [Chloroflexaceae bacterium]|nr:transcriptional regulator [Chloroflexaceae bacterium]NJL35082.1 transcriptional regulator [Chloroflexaceae bacterium]NJO04100.1 transcriptional regulator [Chloroflexaceae bacterium]